MIGLGGICWFILKNHEKILSRIPWARERRVEAALKEKGDYLKKLFTFKNLPHPPSKIAILVFKRERSLEVWAFSPESRKYQLVKTYRICATSGMLGPKRREGDLQIPEGFYYIDRFNPRSHFYLSLGINYPNASDRIRGDENSPGGDIFIHGGCATLGCLPITDDSIKEVYLMAWLAKRSGQRKIPVLIFPCRMTQSCMDFLTRLAERESYWKTLKSRIGKAHPKTPQELVSFWKELKAIYDYFEREGNLPKVTISPTGQYQIANPPRKPIGRASS